MKHDEFVGRVQHLARLSSRGDAEHAIRIVLGTLGERIQRGEADDLASQLPRELGRHLFQSDFQESFDLDEFLWRVADRLGMQPPDATYAARSVIEVMMEAVSRGEIEDVLAQLPAEYYRLFVGAWGQMPPEDLSANQYRQIWEEMQADRAIWMRQEGWLNPPQAGGPQAGQQIQQGWQGQGQRQGGQQRRGGQQDWQGQGQRQGDQQGWQGRGSQQDWEGQQGFQNERAGPSQGQQAWQGQQGQQRRQVQRGEQRWEDQQGRQGRQGRQSQGRQGGQEQQRWGGQEGRQGQGYPQSQQSGRRQQTQGYPQGQENW